MEEDKLDKKDLFDNVEGYDDDYDTETEIDVGNSKLANKAFAIQNMISDFEYRLRGFVWKNNGEKYVYHGNPLAGKRTIQEVMLLLDPFSKSVNMIGNKKDFTWQKQLLRTRIQLASILTTANDSSSKNFKEIWRTFSNLMFNIGDIILGKNSQNMLKSVFGVREGDKFGYPKPKEGGDFYE